MPDKKRIIFLTHFEQITRHILFYQFVEIKINRFTKTGFVLVKS